MIIIDLVLVLVLGLEGLVLVLVLGCLVLVLVGLVLVLVLGLECLVLVNITDIITGINTKLYTVKSDMSQQILHLIQNT